MRSGKGLKKILYSIALPRLLLSTLYLLSHSSQSSSIINSKIDVSFKSAKEECLKTQKYVFKLRRKCKIPVGENITKVSKTQTIITLENYKNYYIIARTIIIY